MYKTLLTLAVVSITGFSCVSTKQFNELKAKQQECEKNNDQLKEENRKLSTGNTELGARIEELKRQNTELEKDSARISSELQQLRKQQESLKSDYDELLAKHEKMQTGSNEESRKLIADLQKTQEEIQVKEDRLKSLEAELNKKQVTLDETNARLKVREDRVKELEGILHRKDSAVIALRNTVADALLGFKDKGLTVEQRNGKVYVSLEEQLLFASGSTTVDKKGEEAIRQLAKVLEKNADINVMIEGHTDDVPITGGAVKDNWDLSVLRATSIVRILTSAGKIDPKRLVAAGRGEFSPIDPAKTAEARRKNRRTEIILTPKLDELLKVLGSN